MADIIDTLHPKNNPSTNLYPYIVLECIGDDIKNYLNNKYITLDTEQTITGIKYIKVGNTSLENIACYETDTIFEKPTIFKNIVDFNTNVNLKDNVFITYTIDDNSSSLIAINKNYVDNKFITLDTEQTITGIKYIKVGNTSLENIACYETDTIFEKPAIFKNIICNLIYSRDNHNITTYLSDENKLILGNGAVKTLIIGNDDRPYYSKSDSDVEGKEIALLTDLNNFNISINYFELQNYIGKTIEIMPNNDAETFELDFASGAYFNNCLYTRIWVYDSDTIYINIQFIDTNASHILPNAPLQINGDVITKIL